MKEYDAPLTSEKARISQMFHAWGSCVHSRIPCAGAPQPFLYSLLEFRGGNLDWIGLFRIRIILLDFASNYYIFCNRFVKTSVPDPYRSGTSTCSTGLRIRILLFSSALVFQDPNKKKYFQVFWIGASTRRIKCPNTVQFIRIPNINEAQERPIGHK